jgi:DNA-binding transcriptional regulator GbsR (MarR family)
MELPADLETLVVHFGEMGSRWGFNRTVGQMLAVFVFHKEPLNADQLTTMLGISRGNVSMALKELQSWQLIRQHNVTGDRKDYFKHAGSILALAIQVMNERRKREIEPTLSLLRGQLMADNSQTSSYAIDQVNEIHQLLELLNSWFDDMQKMKPETLLGLLKLGGGVGKILELTSKLSFKPSKK